MSAYYNENDKFAASWLRELIKAGLISNGEVDERSIEDVKPSELVGYKQCHFFAGIGGWSYALRLAGWPDDREVWTGSCPCQPFSTIGQRKGFQDARHLWPAWYGLVEKLKPPVIFGEQVANAKLWLDTVFTDLETSGYACGSVDLPAACVGAPHARQRIWFVADADETRWQDFEGLTASETWAEVGTAFSVAHSDAFRDFCGPIEPNKSWIVDGLSGEGLAVSAYGNAIVPQVAEAFIRSYLEIPE